MRSIQNGGYTILDMTATSAAGYQNRGFAIAINEKAPSKYVTWRYSESSKGDFDFYSGNYFSDERRAYQDYHERIAESFRYSGK